MRDDVDDATVQAFLDAGYTQRQVLEVVLDIAQKVMSNYTNHLAKTPSGPHHARFAWAPPLTTA